MKRTLWPLSYTGMVHEFSMKKLAGGGGVGPPWLASRACVLAEGPPSSVTMRPAIRYNPAA